MISYHSDKKFYISRIDRKDIEKEIKVNNKNLASLYIRDDYRITIKLDFKRLEKLDLDLIFQGKKSISIKKMLNVVDIELLKKYLEVVNYETF